VGFFVGCTFDYDPRLKPAALSAFRVLQNMGIEVAVPAGQVCCGLPCYEVGGREELQALLAKNIQAFKEAGCREIVTLCSGCGWAGKKLWPGLFRDVLGKEMDFKVMDFTEFIVERGIPGDALQKLKKKVTYHDACLLKRGQGIYEQPRQVIGAIPGIEFVEMPEADTCCGGGGGVRTNHFELAQRILRRKMIFTKEAEVEAIVTCCPTCIRQLTMGLHQAKRRKVRVVHPAVLLSEAMG
jgi:fumarate reductase (CoM/CoB) subunit B